MLKKKVTAVLAVILTMILCSCSSVSDILDDSSVGFNDSYTDYLSNHEEKYPPSVLDTLELMLDNYVSGTATPPPSSIPSNSVPSGSKDSTDIIDKSDSVISSESELVDYIYDAVKNVESQISFEASGNWCTEDVIYDAIFTQVNDVYMIDAFGINKYMLTYTQNTTGNYVYQMDLIYIDNLSKNEILDLRNKIERKAKDVVVNLNLGSMSEYERIYEINKYLCDNVYYPDAPYITHDFTPYGALIDGRAVCDGYARATKILADICNLECYYVPGTCGTGADTIGHAWNLVKIDGDYYQLDVTWNDSGQTNDYFLVTDDFMSLSRVWDVSNYPPSAKNVYTP